MSSFANLLRPGLDSDVLGWLTLGSIMDFPEGRPPSSSFSYFNFKLPADKHGVVPVLRQIVGTWNKILDEQITGNDF